MARQSISAFVGLFALGFTVFASVTADAQLVNAKQPAPVAAPPKVATSPKSVTPSPVPNLVIVQAELKKLKSDLAAHREAQKVIKTYVELGAAVVAILGAIIAIVSIVGIALQVIAFRVEARIRVRHQEEEAKTRARYQEENAKQTAREESLNDRYVKLLEVASGAAEQAQQKVIALEEGGIKRASDTLQLINNLLAITERAAAKAAGAQFEFLSRSIKNLDEECRKLIVVAIREDERDIVGKPAFSEQVRVLTKQIESLDHQITLYNESVPQQLGTVADASNSPQAGLRGWTRLSLTGPCLFIRGLNNHLDQNFTEAIRDWRKSQVVKGNNSVQVDANYWIGYVNNTIGNFEEAREYFRIAASYRLRIER